MEDYIAFGNISKQFPGVLALNNISFGVPEGSVRGLIGENGAGKSTLLKILSGAHPATSGTLKINREVQHFTSTGDAIDAGVAVIYQELQLVPEMTVAENLYLGHLPGWLGWVDKKKLRDDSLQQLERLGEKIDPKTRLGRLPIAQRQMVEIAKALSRGAKVIAFDEPTSSLSERETERLFKIIRELRDDGCVVLYVSHRMEEIFNVCDSTTVFRDGQHVETFTSMEGVTHDILVNRMVGRDIEDIYNYQPRPHGEPVLQVDGVIGPGLTKPVSLEVKAGEIVGLFGLVGAGRSELLKLLYGAVHNEAGSVRLDGAEVNISSPAQAIKAGIALCPEDRKQEGIIPIRSVQENLNLSARRHHCRLGFWINRLWERKNVNEQINKLAIKTPSPAQPIQYLSGGNQQKVILARWLSEEVRVMLLDEPTRGIDVGAKNEIYSIIYELAQQGMAVVVVSSDLPEVMGLSDRIVVMREGELVGSVPREEADEEKILHMALPIETSVNSA